MPSKIAGQLIDSNKFFSYNLRVLQEVKERSRITRSLLDEFDFYLNISFLDDDVLEFYEPNRMVVGFRRVMDSGRLQEATFVAENLNDAHAYELGGKSFLVPRKLYSEYDVRLRHLNGGGNTTIDVFKREVDSGRFVFCLLDSDRKHPEGKLGDTASRFKIFNNGYGGGYYLGVLDCTEIENIIPKKIVREVVSGYKPEALDGFDGVTVAVRKYLDHKKGLTVEDALRLDDVHGGNHWSTLIEGLGLKGNFVCPALGENLLAHCIDFMNKSSLHKLCEFIDDEVDVDWVDISRKVASWGVGLKRAIR